MQTPQPYTVAVKEGVLTVRFSGISAGWEQSILLRSDAHHDSMLCDRTLEMAHLEEAKQRAALIFDGGDLFDAMQGTGDRRGSYDELRPEDKTGDYHSSIIDHAVDDYGPFAPLWVLAALGNHESAVRKYANTDLTSMFVKGMRGAGARYIQPGAYAGWVRFIFKVHKTISQTVLLRYFHGAGGSGSANKGITDVDKQAAYLPDANIVWNGHNHQNYLHAAARERCSRQNGEVWQDSQWYVRTPGYKNRGQWEQEKGHKPGAHGAAWLTFSLRPHTSKIKIAISMDLE